MRYRVVDFKCDTLASFDNLDDAFAFADVSRAYYIVDDEEDKLYVPQHRLFDLEDALPFYSKMWTCTDPDQYQFCHKVNDTTFEYIQLKPYYYDKVKGLEPGTDVLDFLSGKTFNKEWYHDVIDVNDLDADEIKEVLAPYGFPKEYIDNQIVAECIFETDVVGEDFYGIQKL